MSICHSKIATLRGPHEGKMDHARQSYGLSPNDRSKNPQDRDCLLVAVEAHPYDDGSGHDDLVLLVCQYTESPEAFGEREFKTIRFFVQKANASTLAHQLANMTWPVRQMGMAIVKKD
jgi:hypothetical protein